MTPEGKVKEKIKQVLREHGAYYHMPVQNGMGKPSLDFIGCINGRFIAVEAKAERGSLTLRQKATIADMEAAGAFVLVIQGVDDPAFDQLERYLQLNKLR